MTMDISATMGYLTSLMDFSYLDSYFENTSSMFIALVFVLLTMVLLSVFEYLSKLKLKTRQELEEENSKREAKAQKKKSQKKKKNEREELAQEARYVIVYATNCLLYTGTQGAFYDDS